MRRTERERLARKRELERYAGLKNAHRRGSAELPRQISQGGRLVRGGRAVALRSVELRDHRTRAGGERTRARKKVEECNDDRRTGEAEAAAARGGAWRNLQGVRRAGCSNGSPHTRAGPYSSVRDAPRTVRLGGRVRLRSDNQKVSPSSPRRRRHLSRLRAGRSGERREIQTGQRAGRKAGEAGDRAAWVGDRAASVGRSSALSGSSALRTAMTTGACIGRRWPTRRTWGSS